MAGLEGFLSRKSYGGASLQIRNAPALWTFCLARRAETEQPRASARLGFSPWEGAPNRNRPESSSNPLRGWFSPPAFRKDCLVCVGNQSSIRPPLPGDFLVLSVPGLKPWAILCSPFGRFEHARDISITAGFATLGRPLLGRPMTALYVSKFYSRSRTHRIAKC